jgi:deoxyadenosine/deoxycytidine kinase
VPPAFDAHEHERAVVGASEARFEGAHERHAAHAQLQAIDPHRFLPNDTMPLAPARDALRAKLGGRYTPGGVPFRYIAIEGPIGVGKTRLARRLAARLEGTAITEDPDNPFLADFYNDRPGAALQAQLFYLLNRHRQLSNLRQTSLFDHTLVCDYVFDKDRIFAFLNLDDNELFIYQRLHDLLAKDVPAPDLVLYLQAPADVLLARIKARPADPDQDVPRPDEQSLRELNEAYQHFFFHYAATPLLVVETSQFDPEASDEALDDLVRQIAGMGKGTRYYVPRTTP